MMQGKISLLNTTDEQLTTEICALVNNDEKYIAEARTLANAKNHVALVGLVASRLAAFVSVASEVDIQTAFAGIGVFLQQNPDQGSIKQIISACLAAAKDLTDNTTQSLGMMQGLTILFNVLPVSYRYDIFLALVQIASGAKVLDVLTPQISAIDSCTDQWQLDPHQRRQLYLVIAEAFEHQGLETNGLEYYHFLLKYLAAHDGSDSEKMVTPYVLKAMSFAIRLPSVIDVQPLLSLPVISAYQAQPLYQLLKFLSSSDIQSAFAFLAKHDADLAQSNLSKEVVERKFRLAALAQYAASRLLTPVSFAELAQLMHFDEKRVEIMIVDAVRLHLVEARIDQLQRKVTFTNASVNTLNATHWSFIHTKLSSWRQKVELMLTHLDKTVEPVAPA